jgi:hypothetical protein
MGGGMLLADTVDGVWRLGIGDPTLIGWATVVAYFAAVWGCARAAWREPLADGSPRVKPSRFWLALAALMLALGINKQLDLQTLVTDVGRNVVVSLGLYERRRVYQKWFIVSVALACLGLLATLLRLCRGSLRRRWVALVGMVFILGFVMIRASSFHHIDAFLASRLGGLKWNWLLELGGIGLVALSAFRVGRTSRPQQAGRQQSS